MRSVKQIDEDMMAAAWAARRIYERAKRENRDFTPQEGAEFNVHAQVADKFRAELDGAKARDKNILNLGQKHMQFSNQTFNQNFPQVTPVLPVNGQPQDGQSQPRYNPHVRVGKLRAFADEQTAFDSGQWLKAVVARESRTADHRAEAYCKAIGLEITTAAYEGSGVAGGYLVPAPLSAAIIQVRERVGVARQVCRVLPTSGDTLSVPKKTGGLTVYVVGENTAITASDKSWGQVACAVHKRACLSYLSQELAEDALINVVDDLTSEMGYALALQEDDELINGTGASTYGGIHGLLSSIGTSGVSTAATGHDTWGELDLADVMAAVGKLPDRYFAYGPAFVCSHSFYNNVMVRLAYQAGGVTAAEVMSGTANVRSFAGYPVYLTSKMPTATATATRCLLFGAFSQAVLFVDKGGIRLQRSDDVKFIEDQIALKAVSRYDMNVHDYGDNSSSPGAYVALATAS